MSDNEQTNKKLETVADILEEMRGMGNYQRYSGDHAHALADRIEAALKRECDRLVSEPRSWEECVARAMKVKETSDVLY